MKKIFFTVITCAAVSLLLVPSLLAQDAYQGDSSDDERPVRALSAPRSAALRETASPAKGGMDPAAMKKLDDILKGVNELKDEVKKLKDDLGVIRIRVTQSQ